MKVSLNWVKQFLDFEVPPIAEVVERIGSQLGEVKEVEDLGAKYQGVLTVKIMSCVDHPDSDHMHVCMIDDGGKAQDVERDENGYVQVVCGAPNVREGLTVAWLPPGSTVPESVGKDPFVLGKRELRGVMSNGMLASPRELALGDSHEGILEIDTDVAPGSDFAPVYKLDDYIIDIENKMFTHRPDCFGQLGVAREVAGILGHQFHSPDWYLHRLNEVYGEGGHEIQFPVGVHNEVPELVPRVVAISLSGITIKESPVWLQTYLQRVGVRPINNVVDITNYMMLLTGQPSHAYDYDKVKSFGGEAAPYLTVRYPRPGETIQLLNGKTIEPREEAIMIASGDHLIGVAGVMGGFDTEVEQHTTRIILEVATFDMYSVRRTSMAHGLFTDAVTRFNKGQSPLQNDKVASKIVAMLQDLAGATVEGVVDDNTAVNRQWVHPPIEITTGFVNARLGFDLSGDAMKLLLQNVECVVDANENELAVTAPFWRTDIETREDVVEEIGRLYGFDKLPLELPQRSIQPAAKDSLLELKRQIRGTLAKAGANEVLTYSFVHADLIRKAGQDPEQAFKLSNALSPDLQHYRLSLTPSLLDKVHSNIKSGYGEFALFEIGKAHSQRHKDDPVPDDIPAVPAEYQRLAVVIAKDSKAVSGNGGAPFYLAKQYLDAVLKETGLKEQVKLVPYDSETYVGSTLNKTPMYEVGRTASILIGEFCLGEIGEYRANVRKALKLPAYCAGFEIDVSILEQYRQAQKEYHELPRFPKVTQDISLELAAELAYSAVYSAAAQALQAVLPDLTVADFRPLDIYQAEDSDKKRLTFRLEIASYERTMTDKEVAVLLDHVAAAAKDTFGAERV